MAFIAPSIRRQTAETYRPIKTFEPLPWQVEPWTDYSPILLLTGSAGGGKSRLAAERMHAFMLRYPESTGLILRKSRASLHNSALALLRSEVMGNDPRVRHIASRNRFEYHNGSILAYGGMKDDDQREYIRSIGQKGGLDICWMEEATQFTEGDFNEVMARMRGTAAPWTQVILTTNPHGPAHWINVRLILGLEASVYRSRAADNSHLPLSYTEKRLSRLTGVQRKRLAEGQWVAGEGVVFDTWLDDYNGATGRDYGGNVRLAADYTPAAGPVLWVIDDGYAGQRNEHNGMFTGRSHPRAVLFVQRRFDGFLHVFAESYAVRTLATDHVLALKALSAEKGWPLPAYVIQDRAAASLVGVLERESLEPVFNHVPVEESIKVVLEALSPDENGLRRLLVHPRCAYLRYEMLTYSYDESGNVIKEHDHGPDCLKYLLWNEDFGSVSEVDIATWDGAR